MYSRLCTTGLAKAGRIHTLLRKCGLHPLARNPMASSSKPGDEPSVSIELPADELDKGRKILAKDEK